MYQEAELHGFLTSENTLIGTLSDESTLYGILSSGVGAAGDYNNLINKPLINNYVLEGNKTAAQLGFADVAVTGDYDDLTDKPTIPTKTSDLTNDSGFITSSDIPTIPTKTSELTNDSGFITSADIPTKTSELTNDSGFVTSADIPTKTSELTNDSGFITSADVPTKTSDLINDSGFITSGDIPHKTSELINDSGFITLSDVPTKTSDLLNDSGFVTTSDLSTVAVTGDYDDLTNKPTLATVAVTGDYDDLTNKPTLATVATTGDYTDLINKPTIPTKTSELTNDSGFITSAVTDNIIQAIQNAAACFSASGSIASFNTDISDKLFSCYVNVTAQQAGSGTPSPDNVRAISGWSECNLVGCQKNILDYDAWKSSTPTASRCTYVFQNNGISVTATAGDGYCRPSYEIPVRSGQEITLSWSSESNIVGTVYVFFSDSNFVNVLNSAQKLTTTIPNDCSKIRIRFGVANTGNTINYKNLQIEYNSTSTTYEPYNGTTHNIPFNQTVYGGVLDVLSGVLTVTHGYIASYNGETINTPWICSQAEYAQGVTPPTGSQVVYPLTTSTVIQLTPTEVKTILGQNNIFADCGDIDLKYLETIGNLLT